MRIDAVGHRADERTGGRLRLVENDRDGVPEGRNPILVDKLGDEKDGAVVQNIVYEVGKAHAFEPLRAWFGALYEVLLGQTQGPRFGSFAALFGTANTAAMIRSALVGEFLK